MFIQEPYSCNYKQNTKANTKQKYKNEILLLISCLYSYCFDQNHVLSHLLLPWLPEIRKWRCKDGGKSGPCHPLENKHKYIRIRSNQDILWQRRSLCWDVGYDHSPLALMIITVIRCWGLSILSDDDHCDEHADGQIIQGSWWSGVIMAQGGWEVGEGGDWGLWVKASETIWTLSL